MTKMADAASHPSLTRPARLAEEIYSVLYAQLMSLKIPPDGRISVDNLVRELGVSQTPIREALARLESQGLVIKRHLVGYSAAPQMDRDRIEELYEIRELIEPFAAARAACNVDASMLDKLDELNRQMQESDKQETRRAYSQFARTDGAFHETIALASGNSLIHDALARLHAHVHLFRTRFHARATSEANVEHDNIMEAIRRRDPDAAGAAMRHHIEQSRRRFTEDSE